MRLPMPNKQQVLYQTYSFTPARIKYFLSQEIRLVLFFFTMTLFVLFSTYFILLYKTNSFTQKKQVYTKSAYDLNVSIVKQSHAVEYIYAQAALSENIYTKNSIVKDSIHNLFDLVPDKIVLSSVELGRYSLIMYGRTPTKDMYNFRLHAPLRSLFHESYSSFYPAKNGWYFFVSKNYLHKDDMK